MTQSNKTGVVNASSITSADPERNLVFIPTSSPSPDFYGGERKGDNRYANSVVALRASTGKVVWQFQVVDHDLWDYNVASQPVLINVKRNGKEIPAVAIGTKMGMLFVPDRRDGKLVFPVEERAVPLIYAVNSKQCVVICADGHGKLGTKRGDFVVAFALP